jgi:hypothetical protein
MICFVIYIFAPFDDFKWNYATVIILGIHVCAVQQQFEDVKKMYSESRKRYRLDAGKAAKNQWEKQGNGTVIEEMGTREFKPPKYY